MTPESIERGESMQRLSSDFAEEVAPCATHTID